MSRADLRTAAYRYVQERLCRLSAGRCEADPGLIPLGELLLLRDGAADPSPALIEALSQLFRGQVPEAEIYANLVRPFTDE